MVRRNDELPFFTDRYQWQCFLPSIDQCVHRKRGRFAVLQTALVGQGFLLNWRECEFTWRFFHLHLSGNLSYSAFCHCREHAIGEVRKIGVVIRYGVGSAMVFGSRFMVTAAAAVTAEVLYGVWWLRPKIIDVSWLALLAFALIVIPNFSLQLGIARCTALAVNTIRALGPVFVSAAQQLSDWLSFSGATLVCVIIFAISTALASVLCARDE